jgi:ABC-2 type transport system ATP-binding protein
MDEAEKLCDRIAFIDNGHLIALDTLENLKQLLPAGDLIEIGLDRTDDRVLPGIRGNQLVNSAEFKGNTLNISAKNGSRVLPAIINVFDEYSLPMNSISIHSPSLEDVFIYLTGSKLDSGNNEGAQPGGRGRPS